MVHLNYAKIFLEHFNYRKTSIFSDNKRLSNRLYEEASLLRTQLQELSKKNQHTVAEVINIVTNTMNSVRCERDKYRQSSEKSYQHTKDISVKCERCHGSLVRSYYDVTVTFFAYKPANFERTTAYAMYRISAAESAANDLLTSIKLAFKALAFKLGIWTPRRAPENESIDDFLKWMHNLVPKREEETSEESMLSSCNSIVCVPPPVVNIYPYPSYPYNFHPDTHYHGGPSHQHGVYMHQHGDTTHQHGVYMHQHGVNIHQHGDTTHQHGVNMHQHGNTTHQHADNTHYHGHNSYSHGHF